MPDPSGTARIRPGSDSAAIADAKSPATGSATGSGGCPPDIDAMTKLAARDRAQLVVFAYESGLVAARERQS